MRTMVIFVLLLKNVMYNIYKYLVKIGSAVMKYILYIGDGMADNPVPELNGKTPIEVASIPNIDKLASKGIVGSVKNVPVGLPAGSDTAILSILGNDIADKYSGRAPLEAAAMDIFPEAGCAAYRCNIAAVEDNDLPFEERRVISHSAGSIEGEDALAIVGDLLADAEFSKLLADAGMTIYKNAGFRQIATQKGADLKGIILPPPHDHLGELVGDLRPSGCANADVLWEIMNASFKFMDKHPVNDRRRKEGKMAANCLWFWAEGTAMELESFSEKYGMKGAVVSAVPLVQGIAKLIGLDVFYVDGATGEIDTNFEGKAEKTIELLDDYDFVVLHIEAPDECTHNGDLKGKIQSIEWLDSRVLTTVLKHLSDNNIDFRLMFLSDHKTLTETKGHDGDPVPYLLYDSTDEQLTDARFSEAQGEKGPYIDKGIKLLDLLFRR